MAEFPRGGGPEGGIPSRPSLFEQSQNELGLISRKEASGTATGDDIIRKGEVVNTRRGWGANARRFGLLEDADGNIQKVVNDIARRNSDDEEKAQRESLEQTRELVRGDKFAQDTELDTWGERRFGNHPDLQQSTYRGMVKVYVKEALEDIRDALRGQGLPQHEEWQWDFAEAVRRAEATVAAGGAGAEPAPAGPPPPRGPNPPLAPGGAGSPEVPGGGLRVVWENAELPATTGRAFSRRWTRRHGLPDMIAANEFRGIYQDIYPSEVLSDVADVGQNGLLGEELRIALNVSRDREFRNAIIAGLLPLLSLDSAMKSSRITTISGLIGSKSEMGRSIPSGISQFLKGDDETRRVLAILFKAQGYTVANEPGVNDTVPTNVPGVRHAFSEYADLRPGRTAEEIEKFLEAVQQKVGTDKGIVTLAYTIFRYLGHAHSNKKFVEVREKYTKRRDPVTREIKGFYKPEELAPFVNKVSVRGKRLSEIIATDGVLGLARALGNIDTEEIGRWWDDTLTMLDGGDAANDLMQATGGAALILNAEDREKKLFQVEQVAILLAKRRISEETASEFTRIARAYQGRSALEPSWTTKVRRDTARVLGEAGIGWRFSHRARNVKGPPEDD